MIIIRNGLLRYKQDGAIERGIEMSLEGYVTIQKGHKKPRFMATNKLGDYLHSLALNHYAILMIQGIDAFDIKEPQIVAMRRFEALESTLAAYSSYQALIYMGEQMPRFHSFYWERNLAEWAETL